MRQAKHTLPYLLLLLPLLFGGCRVSYTFSGASISPEMKTVSIARFPNNALLVAPILSSTLTEALQDRFARQTKLTLVPEGGDLNFEGEITNYTSTPAAISGDEYAVLNNLTITVRVRFTNSVDPALNYDKTFSAFSTYESSKLLQEVEPTLIPEIVEQLVEDIFNAAVSNW
ncbi:MAG: LptE family protein [Alistipes sp.]|nr:LptE family protein [Alistipes sp.]